MTTNWRDKWRERTRGGYEVVNVWEGANGLRIEIICIRGDMQKKDEIFVEPDGRAMKSCETLFDLLPITPPAEPVPQDLAALRRDAERCDDLAAALSDLYAMVNGECPSLLNEDSGGNAELDLRIAALLAEQKKRAAVDAMPNQAT